MFIEYITRALQTYQPLDFCKSATRDAREDWNREIKTCLDLCAKVRTAVLVVFCLIPCLFADLLLSATSLLYRAVCWNNSKTDKPTPPITPSREQVEKILGDPHSGEGHVSVPTQAKFCIQDAVEKALDLNPPEKKKRYFESIKSETAFSARWCAEVLLVHYFRTFSHGRIEERRYPAIHPHFVLFPKPDQRSNSQWTEQQAMLIDHQNTVEMLKETFMNLSPQDQASSLLKILVPDTNWALEKPAAAFVQRVRNRACLMSNDAYFKEILNEGLVLSDLFDQIIVFK